MALACRGSTSSIGMFRRVAISSTVSVPGRQRILEGYKFIKTITVTKTLFRFPRIQVINLSNNFEWLNVTTKITILRWALSNNIFLFYGFSYDTLSRKKKHNNNLANSIKLKQLIRHSFGAVGPNDSQRQNYVQALFYAQNTLPKKKDSL